jgi:hypothetical protein
MREATRSTLKNNHCTDGEEGTEEEEEEEEEFVLTTKIKR